MGGSVATSTASSSRIRLIDENMQVRETVVSIDDVVLDGPVRRRTSRKTEVPEEYMSLPNLKELMNAKVEDMNFIYISRDPTDDDMETTNFVSFDQAITSEVFVHPYYPLSDVITSTMRHREGFETDHILEQMEESDSILDASEVEVESEELPTRATDAANLKDELYEPTDQHHKPNELSGYEVSEEALMAEARAEARLQHYRDSHRTVQVQCGGSAIIDQKNPDVAAQRIFRIFEEKRDRQMTKYEIREKVNEFDRIRSGTGANHELCTSLHLISLIFAVLYGSYLIVQAVREPGIAPEGYTTFQTAKIVGFSLYLCSLLYYFVISVLHHGVGVGAGGSWGAYKALSTLDICGLFSLFAGVSTPITLVVLNNGIGWTLWGVLLVTIIGGIVLQAIGNVKIPKFINFCWWLLQLLIVAMQTPSLYDKLGVVAMRYWVAGNLCYFMSMVMYGSKKPRIFSWLGPHELQHLFIMAACVFEYKLMYNYVRVYVVKA